MNNKFENIPTSIRKIDGQIIERLNEFSSNIMGCEICNQKVVISPIGKGDLNIALKCWMHDARKKEEAYQKDYKTASLKCSLCGKNKATHKKNAKDADCREFVPINKETFDRRHYPFLFDDKNAFKMGLGQDEYFSGTGEEEPNCICMDCQKEHPDLIKHWGKVQKVNRLLSDMQDSHEKGENALLKEKKYSQYFKGFEQEEHALILRLKNHDNSQIEVWDKELEWRTWGDAKDPRESITGEQAKKIEAAAKAFLKESREFYVKDSEDIYNRHKLLSIYTEEDAMGFYVDGVIININSWYDPSLPEMTVEELREEHLISLNNKKKDFIWHAHNEKGVFYQGIVRMRKKDPVMGDKLLYGYRTKLDSNFWVMKLKSLHLFSVTLNTEPFQPQRSIKTALEIAVAMVSGGEASFDIAEHEFHFYADPHKGKFQYQIRASYCGGPFKEAIEVDKYFGIHVIEMFQTLAAVYDTYQEKTIIDTKITKVGANSRHVVFDKAEGLPRFFNSPRGLYCPDNRAIRVTYTPGRIVIEDKQP